MASSSCSRVHSGASAKGFPVAGLITLKLPLPATALPSIVMLESRIASPRARVGRA
jgi:hypothetical protein